LYLQVSYLQYNLIQPSIHSSFVFSSPGVSDFVDSIFGPAFLDTFPLQIPDYISVIIGLQNYIKVNEFLHPLISPFLDQHFWTGIFRPAFVLNQHSPAFLDQHFWTSILGSAFLVQHFWIIGMGHYRSSILGAECYSCIAILYLLSDMILI